MVTAIVLPQEDETRFLKEPLSGWCLLGFNKNDVGREAIEGNSRAELCKQERANTCCAPIHPPILQARGFLPVGLWKEARKGQEDQVPFIS